MALAIGRMSDGLDANGAEALRNMRWRVVAMGLVARQVPPATPPGGWPRPPARADLLQEVENL
jgi:hypothetical protein